MRFLLFILLCICTIVSYATVYMKTDSAGNISYTDVPSTNAQAVNGITGNTVSSSQAPSETTTPASQSTDNKSNQTQAIAPEEGNKPYQTFTIVSPTDQQTIQNQVVIPVKVATDPELQPGDTVQLVVDGNPWGSPEKNANLEIKLLERGTHQISARLIGENGNILKETTTITIFVHRASSNFNPNTKNSNP